MPSRARIPWCLPLLLAALLASEAPAAKRPNFVFILADDLGFSDLGCYGGEIATPHLDQLAADGLRFTRCYNNGLCVPSRRSLLTGYHYLQAAKLNDGRGVLRPSWIRLLPHYLKPYGYRSYHAGKWHLPLRRQLGTSGFDRSYRLADHNRFFSPQRHSLDEKPLPPPDRENGYYATTAITDHALDFLREHHAAPEGNRSPFLLYLAYTAPHFPLHASPGDRAKYEGRYLAGWDVIREQRWRRLRQMGLIRAELAPRPKRVPPPVVLTSPEFPDPLSVLGAGETKLAPAWTDLTDEQQRFQATKMALHAAMVTAMDREIGRVVKQLRTMGILDDTVIFFASDNGACATVMVRGDGHDPDAPAGSATSYLCLGPGWANAANSPMRMHKVWTYEGGVATPLIAHWPAGIRNGGEIRRTPVHFVDVVPTLVELAGGKESDSRRNHAGPPLSGRSFATCFTKDTGLERASIFLSQPQDYRVITPEQDRMPRSNERGFHGLVTERFKLVKSHGSTWELYDLTDDRGEVSNLANAMPDKLRELAGRWSATSLQYQRDAVIP